MNRAERFLRHHDPILHGQMLHWLQDEVDLLFDMRHLARRYHVRINEGYTAWERPIRPHRGKDTQVPRARGHHLRDPLDAWFPEAAAAMRVIALGEGARPIRPGELTGVQRSYYLDDRIKLAFPAIPWDLMVVLRHMTAHPEHLNWRNALADDYPAMSSQLYAAAELMEKLDIRYDWRHGKFKHRESSHSVQKMRQTLCHDGTSSLLLSVKEMNHSIDMLRFMAQSAEQVEHYRDCDSLSQTPPVERTGMVNDALCYQQLLIGTLCRHIDQEWGLTSFFHRPQDRRPFSEIIRRRNSLAHRCNVSLQNPHDFSPFNEAAPLIAQQLIRLEQADHHQGTAMRPGNPPLQTYRLKQVANQMGTPPEQVQLFEARLHDLIRNRPSGVEKTPFCSVEDQERIGRLLAGLYRLMDQRKRDGQLPPSLQQAWWNKLQDCTPVVQRVFDEVLDPLTLGYSVYRGLEEAIIFYDETRIMMQNRLETGTGKPIRPVQDYYLSSALHAVALHSDGEQRSWISAMPRVLELALNAGAHTAQEIAEELHSEPILRPMIQAAVACSLTHHAYDGALDSFAAALGVVPLRPDIKLLNTARHNLVRLSGEGSREAKLIADCLTEIVKINALAQCQGERIYA